MKCHYHFPPNFPANKCSHALLVKILKILLVNDAGHCKCRLERKYSAHLTEEEAETMPRPNSLLFPLPLGHRNQVGQRGAGGVWEPPSSSMLSDGSSPRCEPQSLPSRDRTCLRPRTERARGKAEGGSVSGPYLTAGAPPRRSAPIPWPPRACAKPPPTKYSQTTASPPPPL